jgi:DNA-binding CsgD family transcriptional regulator
MFWNPRLKLSERDAARLVKRARNGASTAELARDFGVSRETAVYYCHRAGVFPCRIKFARVWAER